MKQINEKFEDKEHKEIEAIKKQTKLNWHDFIIKSAKALKKEVEQNEHKK